jgi:hypothetical protein
MALLFKHKAIYSYVTLKALLICLPAVTIIHDCTLRMRSNIYHVKVNLLCHNIVSRLSIVMSCQWKHNVQLLLYNCV